MNYKLLLAAGAAVSLSACATVTKGSNDTVKISSTPSEATVVFADVSEKLQDQSCMTPCEIKLKRKYSYRTTVSKEGHTPFQTVLVPKVSVSGGTAMAGNILVGGVIGAGVDAATGAMKDLSPNPLTVTLMPTGQSSFATDKKGNKVFSSEDKKKMEMMDDDMEGEAEKISALPTTSSDS